MLGPRLVQLDRRRNLLSRSGHSVAEINRALLAPGLVEFELRKAATASPPSSIERTVLLNLLAGVLEIDKPVSELVGHDLLQLHARVPGNAGDMLRQTASPRRDAVSRTTGPPPARIPRALDRFFQWVSCQGFAELHPVEQMSVAQTRLLEIDPFESLSDATVGIFCNRFPLAAGHPLPTVDPAEAESFWTALQSSWDFSTQGLVEFNLRALERSYDRIASLPA